MCKSTLQFLFAFLCMASALESWLHAGWQSWPREDNGARSFEAKVCAEELVMLGASSLDGLKGLSSRELKMVWPPFSALPDGFVDHLVTLRDCRLQVATVRVSPTIGQISRASSFVGVKSGMCDERDKSPRRARNVELAVFRRGMEILREARLAQTPPHPTLFAEVLRSLATLPANIVRERWKDVDASPIPDLPRARASWYKALPSTKK